MYSDFVNLTLPPEALSDFISSFTGLSVDKVIETASWVPASNPHNQHFHLVKIKTPQGERFIQVNFTIHDYWGHFGWGNPINHIMMPVNIIEGLPTDAINFIRNYVEGVSHQFNALSRTLTFAPSLPQQPLLEKVHQVALSQASPDNIKRAPKAQQTWLEKALSWDQSTPWTFQKANMSAASALVGMCHELGYPMSTIGQMTGLSPASIQLLIKEISDK